METDVKSVDLVPMRSSSVLFPLGFREGLISWGKRKECAGIGGEVELAVICITAGMDTISSENTAWREKDEQEEHQYWLGRVGIGS